MAKRIALFVLGLVLALIAFRVYEVYSGSSMSGPVKPPNVSRGPIEPTPMVVESRDAQGNLEYIIRAVDAQPGHDDAGKSTGETILLEPTATFYEKSGRIMEIVADTCTVVIDPSAKPRGTSLTGAPAPGASAPGGGAKLLTAVRLGRLTGHVRLLMTAKPAAAGDVPGTSLAEAMKGELKIFFADDLIYDRDKSMLTSQGKVFVRADAANFDGSGLTLAISTGPNDSRRVEFLRIDHGDAIIIHHGGKALSGVEPGLGGAATAPGGNAGPAASVAAGGAAAPAGGTGRGTTKPSTKPVEIIPYRLTFEDNVVASAGKGLAANTAASLTAEHLKVLFALTQELTGKPETQPAPVPAATAPVPAAVAAGAAAATTAPATTVPTAVAPTPLPPVQDDDLVVHWKGPLELRPANADDLKLVGGKLSDDQDVALEAVSPAEKPVTVLDPTRFRVLAGRLFFHRAEDRIWLEPGDLQHVELEDFTASTADQPRVTVVCPAVDFLGVMASGSDAKRHATLAGPGTLVLKPANRAGGDTTLTWRDGLDVDMALVPDPKNPGKNVPSIRHALVRGANFHSDTIAFSSDQIDALIANASDAKQPAALEHLLATGHVVADSLRRAGAALPANAPTDGLRGDRMEINTAKGADGRLAPSQMILEGHASAWRYVNKGALASTANAKGALEKEMVNTNKLIADFREKPPGTPAVASAGGIKPADDGVFASMGQIELKHFLADGDARVDILPPDKSKAIVAESDTLDATLNGEWGSGGAIATFAASPQSLKPAVLAMGDADSIEGRQIVLRRKVADDARPLEESIAATGAGRFFFVQPPTKDNPKPQPMLVTWEKEMAFDNLTHQALFTGKPVAQLADDKNGLGKLACEKTLLVQLKEAEIAGTRPATTAANVSPAGNMVLDYIVADGSVDARGGQVNPDGSMLTDLRLSTDHLKYTDKDHSFQTVAGSLVIDDHRPPSDKPGVTNTSGLSAFKWSGALVYGGDANLITFTKDVTYIFIPTKPFKLSAASAGASTQDIKQAQLDAQKLVATLGKSTDAKSTAATSPIGLGMGGKAGGGNELKTVVAEGWPTLKLGDFILKGSTIQFDSGTHIATANGDGDDDASIVIPGQTITLARKIRWDTTKDRSDIQLEGIRGSLRGN